ncbi:MAG TPA: ATP-binding protein, partial [Gemmatimonadaceae bacterium]|nr:ATP-binding protein [Gemmatimonadaceae bacterium]
LRQRPNPMKVWPHALRWRLTLWYSLGLSAMLAALAAGSWLMLRRVMADRADRFLLEARDAFLVELDAEQSASPTTTAAIASAMRDIRFSDIEFLVLDSGLRVMAASTTLRPNGHAGPTPPAVSLDFRRIAEQLRLEPGDVATAPANRLWTIEGPREAFRVTLTTVTFNGSPYTIAAVQSRGWLHDTLRAVTTAYLAAIPAVLLLVALGGYLLARRALAPVAAMGRRAREIEASNLHERLPVTEPRGELGELATLINDLLQRLESAFVQQRRLVADASHELRTPLAVVRAEAEVALAEPTRPEAEYREALRVVQDAGERLSGIVDDLFLLARADGGPVPIRHELLYLDEVLADTVHVLRALANRRGVRIDVAPLPETPVCGDPNLLSRMLLNLIENAIKYSPTESTVTVRLELDDGAALVSVADQGAGIPDEARSHVFERFFRAEAAQADPTAATAGGAGLGLAIAKWVAEAHGGSLMLVRSSPKGSEFRVTLPKGDIPTPPAAPA